MVAARVCAQVRAGGTGPGAPAVVHTPGTEYLCTFDMESCSGHGELYWSTLVTPRECDLPHLYKSGADFGRNFEYRLLCPAAAVWPCARSSPCSSTQGGSRRRRRSGHGRNWRSFLRYLVDTSLERRDIEEREHKAAWLSFVITSSRPRRATGPPSSTP